MPNYRVTVTIRPTPGGTMRQSLSATVHMGSLIETSRKFEELIASLPVPVETDPDGD